MKKNKTVTIVCTVIALLTLLVIIICGRVLNNHNNDDAVMMYTIVAFIFAAPIICGICCLIPAAARNAFAWLSTIIVAAACYAAPMIAANTYEPSTEPEVLMIAFAPCAAGFIIGSVIGLIRKKRAAV